MAKHSFGFENTLKRLRLRSQMLVDDVAEELNYTGEEAINTARQTGDYMDRTGNLRNSIGYEVVTNGQTLFAGTTENSTPATEGQEGSPEKVEAEIKDAFEQYEKGANKEDISLVIVAGMEYGPYVEHKGYNVTATAFIEAKANFERRMQKLKDEFVEDVNKIL